MEDKNKRDAVERRMKKKAAQEANPKVSLTKPISKELSRN